MKYYTETFHIVVDERSVHSFPIKVRRDHPAPHARMWHKARAVYAKHPHFTTRNSDLQREKRAAEYFPDTSSTTQLIWPQKPTLAQPSDISTPFD